VPGTLRDSLAILALLLEQETELDPQEIMTDTAAYSDAIFGLFWLLGYQFSPRLADIGGAKLWRIDRAADYGPFQDIAKSAINLNLIRDNWSDLIRLAGSLKLGHLKAAGIMRTLQIKDRPTTLARALSELGRIVKTLHILLMSIIPPSVGASSSSLIARNCATVSDGASIMASVAKSEVRFAKGKKSSSEPSASP